MKQTRLISLSVSMVLITMALSPIAAYPKRMPTPYRQVIEKVVNMVHDHDIKNELSQYDLNIIDLTWEDTGRSKGSSIGPNISDMTLQVEASGSYRMPVIRYDNFSDTSADIPIEKIFILTGNEKSKKLKKTSLKAFFGNMRQYLHDPSSWKGIRSSLLAPRDTHVLASAQACFLPIAQDGQAVFNPVLYNYQSYEGNPAVLSIVATREGTSVTVIENGRESGDYSYAWGQKLYFNDAGERAKFKGIRVNDFHGDKNNKAVYSEKEAQEKGLDMIMVIQVPLKQRQRINQVYYTGSFSNSDGAMYSPGLCEEKAQSRVKSDVETAVISHGVAEGPFNEINDLAIERDPRFPIRVTIQFYKATSNGIASSSDLYDIAKKIEKVYHDADYVGSLVVDGNTERPTEHTGPRSYPWWHRHKHCPYFPYEEDERLYEPNWGVLEDN